MGEGREGDWECGSCHNRNYAFRSFCNRCKQPRLLVDTKTPADSKWLPRIGDWICSGCTNNNYASREKCKKCGQPKEVAAMPAIAMPGASLPTHAHYFARPNEGFGLNINMGMPSNPGLQQSFSSGSRWPYGGTEKHGLQPPSVWPSGGNNSSGYPSSVNPNQHVMAPKDWRNGDWLCNCGFHNYSSRTQCMKCNASIPVGGPPSMSNPAVPDLFPSLGTKRLAPDEFVNDWDSKRLNAGDNQFLAHGQQLPYQGQQQILGSSNDQAQGQQFPYQGHQQMMGSSNEQAQGMYGFQQTSISAPGVSSGSVPMAPQFHLTVQSPQVALMPTLLGKGAKQWRDGDWMCTNCSNHNFASRLQCNRCNGQKNASTHPLSVA